VHYYSQSLLLAD